MKKVFPILFFSIITIIMIAIFMMDNATIKDENVLEVKAKVLKVDNSETIQAGISKIGYQWVDIEISEGPYKGEKVTASNHLLGDMEIDSFYKEGDKIVAAILVEDEVIKNAKTLEIYRQDWQLILFLLFGLSLLLYARYIGVYALFSFIASLFVIWKYLIPGLLAGKNPLILSTLVLTLLTAIIVFSVAGFTKKGVSAFIGTMAGLLVTVGITLFFGEKLSLDGMTSPYAATLLFSGHLDLNMKHIFYAAIMIGASGAAMDIAMDVAASMEEIKIKKPDIQMKELIQSGFNVGRAVIGTMTTTLLLAYSGGYLTLLMLFMDRNSSFIRMMNLKIVAAEIMRTVVGSIGLVMVAPLTAILAGWILSVDLKAFPIFNHFQRNIKEDPNATNV